MSSHSACCGCCWTERRRRRSCASLTPRRRPPTWPTACSANSRNGRASATAPWRKRSSRAARTRRVRATSSSRGNCSRAPSRALAASRFRRCTPSPNACCASFRSRPTSRPISTFSTRANSKRLLLEARDAALVELGASSESAGALDLVARESGPTIFDALLTEALGCAEIFGAHDDALGYAAALRAPLGLAPGVTVEPCSCCRSFSFLFLHHRATGAGEKPAPRPRRRRACSTRRPIRGALRGRRSGGGCRNRSAADLPGTGSPGRLASAPPGQRVWERAAAGAVLGGLGHRVARRRGASGAPRSRRVVGCPAIAPGDLSRTTVRAGEAGEIRTTTTVLERAGHRLPSAPITSTPWPTSQPRPAISVHVYSPRLASMTHFDVVGGRLSPQRTVRYRAHR